MSGMEKKKFNLIWLPIGILGVVILLLIVMYVRYYVITHVHTSLEAHPTGEWFEIAPEDAICSDGSPLATRMRLGSENKVVVFFYGGGISLNEFTAARPYIGMTMDVEPGFYSADVSDQIPTWCGVGIGDSVRLNPFRDWTIVVVPYATADFHIGDGEFSYTALDGSTSVLHHHGYKNYRAIMDEAIQYLDQPEELLVVGYSAGGYGAAMLTEDLMQNYFPEAGHVTLCVDSSLLLLNNWEEVFRDVWNASDDFTEKLRSNNIIVDFMSYLYETYGDEMTFLYIGSVRDGALTRYQTYFDTGLYAASNRNAWVYTNYLRGMIAQLEERVPTIGIYLFDWLPFSNRPDQFWLTQHTILETRTAFWPLTNRQSAIQWLDACVSGRVTRVGLNLIR